jgi:hypothetical protein
MSHNPQYNMTNLPPAQTRLAVLHWKSLITGKVGHGQPMPKICAIEHAIVADKEFPEILHWVVDA